MDIGRLELDIPYGGKAVLEQVECTPDEFKELLETVVKIAKMEVEKTEIRNRPVGEVR